MAPFDTSYLQTFSPHHRQDKSKRNALKQMGFRLGSKPSQKRIDAAKALCKGFEETISTRKTIGESHNFTLRYITVLSSIFILNQSLHENDALELGALLDNAVIFMKLKTNRSTLADIQQFTKGNRDLETTLEALLDQKSSSSFRSFMDAGHLYLFTNSHLTRERTLVQQRGKGAFKLARDFLVLNKRGRVFEMVIKKTERSLLHQIAAAQEYDICRDLDHPNILPSSLPFYYEGTKRQIASLAEIAEPLPFHSIDQFMLKMHQAAKGVDYLHSNGVCYHDLNYNNLLDLRNQTVLFDFSLSSNLEKGIRCAQASIGGCYYPPEAVYYRSDEFDFIVDDTLINHFKKMDCWSWAITVLSCIHDADLNTADDGFIELKHKWSYSDQKNLNWEEDAENRNLVFSFQKAIIAALTEACTFAPDLKTRRLADLLLNCVQDVDNRYTIQDILKHDYWSRNDYTKRLK